MFLRARFKWNIDTRGWNVHGLLKKLRRGRLWGVMVCKVGLGYDNAVSDRYT
jgi:hypothetical protein